MATSEEEKSLAAGEDPRQGGIASREHAKILLFSSPERQSRIYLDAIGSRYDDVTIGFESPGTFTFERRKRGQSDQTDLSLPHLPRYPTLLCQWSKVFSYVRKESRREPFDLIVSAGIQAALLFPAFRLFRCGLRCIYWAGDWFPNNNWWAFLDRRATRLADDVWNVTKAIQQARIACHGLSADGGGPVVESLFSVPEPPSFRVSSAAKPCFCYLGRAWAGRGVDIALEAMAILRAQGIDLELVITGRQQNADMAFVQTAACKAGVADLLRWTGHLSLQDLNLTLRRCLFGLAVFPGGLDNYSNYTEPGKVSHCLQLGVPVVISKANAMAAEVSESGAGILVDDSPEALADAAERFVNDAALRSQAGMNARAMVERRNSPEGLFRNIDRVLAAGRG